ncbi:MAG: hypothetical protein ACOC9H_02525, partial [Gemmatimonadota bacterium]
PPFPFPLLAPTAALDSPVEPSGHGDVGAERRESALRALVRRRHPRLASVRAASSSPSSRSGSVDLDQGR